MTTSVTQSCATAISCAIVGFFLSLLSSEDVIQWGGDVLTLLEVSIVKHMDLFCDYEDIQRDCV